jgi:hypothetical protein
MLKSAWVARLWRGGTKKILYMRMALHWTRGWQNVEQCVGCKIVERRNKKNIVHEDGASLDKRIAKC